MKILYIITKKGLFGLEIYNSANRTWYMFSDVNIHMLLYSGFINYQDAYKNAISCLIRPENFQIRTMTFKLDEI